MTVLVGGTSNLPANATLTARMHDILETAIITGELEPGQRLQADVLAAQHGMSRIPVREALRSLHEAGWVEIKPRHGVHVRERTPHELGELFEFRAVVEGLVARWAALRRTDAHLAELATIVGSDDASNAPPEVGTSSAFYAALRRAAGNEVLATTSAGLEKRARFYFSTVAHELGDDWIDMQAQLLVHVRAREADTAEAMARRHIEQTGAAVHALLFADA